MSPNQPDVPPEDAKPPTEQEDTAAEAQTDTAQGESKGLSLRQVIGSVFAAGLGVQSSKNRERDFQKGGPVTFIVVGLVFTALFIGTVYTVVTVVLSSR